jgi:uncharacterized protein
MMRLSRYSVISERREDGTWVLMHGMTGAVDIVTDGVVAGLTRYGDFLGAQGRPHQPDALPSPDSVRPLDPEELARLADRGYLTTMSDVEERTALAEIAAVLHDAAARRPSFLALPTIDCNYRCTYCFERPVQLNLRHPGNKSREALGIEASHEAGNVIMTERVVDAMFDAMPVLKARHGDDRDGGQIVLYGGEPLDARNEGIVRHLVNRGTNLGFRFAVVTNGHDVDHFVDLFGAGGIQQVQVSIDGPARVHDRRRIHLGPEGSFDKVVANVALLLERGSTLVQIRVHVDGKNLHHFQELMDDFDARGWLNHPDVIVYANTVYDGGSSRIPIDEIDRRLSDIARPYRNLFLNAPSINVRAKFLPALLDGLQVPVQGNYCTANTGQYVFAPDGHIYSCWESVGKVESRIGSFYSPLDGARLELDEHKTRQWFSRHVGLIPECTACPMALACGGGCAQFALYQNATQLAPYCDNFDGIFRRTLRDVTEALLERLQREVAGESNPGLVAANYG